MERAVVRGCKKFKQILSHKVYLECLIKRHSWNDKVPFHTVDTEFSVTNFFCLHFSEHAQWGLPVMSDILVKIFVDISCNICGLFLF